MCGGGWRESDEEIKEEKEKSRRRNGGYFLSLFWLSKYLAPFGEIENYLWEARVLTIFPFSSLGMCRSQHKWPESALEWGES